MRALSNKDDVSPETRERIINLAKDMRYRPNHIARSLVTGRSRLIGVMTSPGVVSEFAAWLQVIEHRLREVGYSVLFTTSTGLPGGERLCVDQMLHNQVAGVIAVPSTIPTDPEAYQELIDNGVKLVMLGNCIEGLNAPQVLGNDYQATHLATEHLISLGHKRIVYLAIPPTSYTGRERLRGFAETMKNAGIPVTDSSVVETGFGADAGAVIMAEVLRRKDRPTGIIARHDVVAIGAMRAIAAAGLKVPDDISIVGNTDVWFSDVLSAPLTTVRHPWETVLDMGTNALLDMISHKPVNPVATILDVSLVVRSSCARL
ncbi:MAG: LacI family transcriptional regulator [Armatimonadetes bacterium]|nr:LacI family transcriptional regulator [Armatimonadota bacterium]